MVAKKHTQTDNKTSAFSLSFGMLNLTLFSFTLAEHQPLHHTICGGGGMRFLREIKQQKTAKQQSSPHTEPQRPDDMSVWAFWEFCPQTQKDNLLMI
jgi:hypothetical protein